MATRDKNNQIREDSRLVRCGRFALQEQGTQAQGALLYEPGLTEMQHAKQTPCSLDAALNACHVNLSEIKDDDAYSVNRG